MSVPKLYVSEPPWIFVDVLSDEERKRMPSFFYDKPGSSPVIRVLRGHKMATVQGLMDEFGAALQFFDGFGENWYALKDCLCYLDEWMKGDAYILIITRPWRLLRDESSEQLDWLYTTLNEVGDWWSKPIANNEPYNRPPIPFHVVLQFGYLDFRETGSQFSTFPFLRPGFVGSNDMGEGRHPEATTADEDIV